MAQNKIYLTYPAWQGEQQRNKYNINNIPFRLALMKNGEIKEPFCIASTEWQLNIRVDYLVGASDIRNPYEQG